MNNVEDYSGFLEALMISNKKIRFIAICNLNGQIIFQKRSEEAKQLFSLEESKELLKKTIDRWNERSRVKDKIGEPMYSVTAYKKIKRITLPIDSEHLLFLSIDNNDNDIEKFGTFSIKNIHKILEDVTN